MAALNVKATATGVLDDLRRLVPSEVARAAQEQLLPRAEEWALRTEIELAAADPYASHEFPLVAWEVKIEKEAEDEAEYLAAIDRHAALCKVAGQPFDAEFWQSQVNESPRLLDKAARESKLQQTLRTAARLQVRTWRKAFDRARSEWQLEEISRRRDSLRKELETLLSLVHLLARQLEDLGLDLGLLLDLSNGRLSPQDIEQFKRWATYLSNDEGVKALCEVLGKLRQIELSEQVEELKVVHIRDVWLPDTTSREEIIGVRLGRDLEHALPSELALLADPETSILFDMKYIESRLMCFDMRGMQLISEQSEGLIQQTVTDTRKMGPMVICVDTSGSMSGMPETIAKAVALYMAAKAREQKRDCYLINFSTNIQTLDLGLEKGMEALISFLQMSFHGGTDVAPALKHALDTMQLDRYEKADLLVISDFVMGQLPQKLLDAIEAQRQAGTKFYSLVIDGGFHTQRIPTLFDEEWIFDPSSSRLTELGSFQKRVGLCTQQTPDHP